MTYLYLKQSNLDPQQQLKQLVRQHRWYQFKQLLPTILITVGASLLISVGYPIFSYELKLGQKTTRTAIISPVPQEVIAEAKGLVSPINQAQPQALASTTQTPTVSIDYTQLSNWFPFSRPQSSHLSRITHYTISIPKLRIKDALVTIGGETLDNSLVQYGGTANPGEPGNTVIFGHSILPTFYNPKDYRAIFSLLPTLNQGDEILVNFDGIIYKYLVAEYQEVSPDEVDILEQRYNKKELSLITCVPPGTYWRRGIVKAELSEL
jgi:sortase A